VTTANPFLHNAHFQGKPFSLEVPSATTAFLLLHGLTATPWEVRHLGDCLFNNGYTVDGPLLPGHGTPPKDMNHVSWQDWAAVALEHYEKLAARYPHVIVGGESTGAVLALWLAAQKPDISAILAYAPAIQLPLSPVQVLLLHLLSPLGFPMPKQGIDQDTIWQGYRVNQPRGVLELLASQKAVLPLLATIHQPILIVQGRHDHTITPASAEIVSSGVQSRINEVHWMAESGHCVLLDKEFDRVWQITRDFINHQLTVS
jgi:carboxylesterase